MIKGNTVKIISFTGYGFASGLPYVLIFITLTAWLRDVGIDLSLIGFISWIMLTYSLKFLWAPFVDQQNYLKDLGIEEVGSLQCNFK